MRSTTMDPVWLLMSAFTAMEVLVVMVLVMPMPSNAVRGRLTQAINQKWATSHTLKKLCWVMLTLNAYYAYSSIAELREAHAVMSSATCETRATTLYLERNAYICGFSVFLFFVLRRLLEIQGQLHATRAIVKDAAIKEAQALTDASAGSDKGAQQQRLGALSRVRELERQVSEVLQEEDSVAAGAPARPGSPLKRGLERVLGTKQA